MLSIIDPTARTNALTTGEVDVMDRPDLKTASRLGKKPGIVIEETTGYLHYTFPMRTDTAPFDDNNVRMALKHAVNREEIVEKILYGHGTVGNDHPIAPSVAYHAADLEQRQYDPDKAKFYAKKAGGINVKLSAADAAFAGAVDAATLYKEHAAAAGIEIEVVREPNDGYWSNRNVGPCILKCSRSSKMKAVLSYPCLQTMSGRHQTKLPMAQWHKTGRWMATNSWKNGGLPDRLLDRLEY